MADTKLDLDLVFIDIRLPSGTTTRKTLNTFLFDEKRTIEGTRVSSDYDYDKFRAWVKNSLGIADNVVLQIEGTRTWDITDELSFETAILLLQCGDCETFDGPSPKLRVCRMRPAPGIPASGKSSVRSSVGFKTPTATGRPSSSPMSEDIYGATPPDKGKGKQVATEGAVPSIENDSMIVTPQTNVSDTPSFSTLSPVEASRSDAPSRSLRLSSLMEDETDGDDAVPDADADNADDDENAEEDDYVDDPDALLNTPANDFIVRTDIPAKSWEETCHMFQCSQDIEALKLPGLKLSIKNWQLLAIFKMLTQYSSRYIPGVMLGDEMGLGKTAEALCVIVVHHYIHEAHAAVKAEWTRTATGRKLRLTHLPEDDQAPNAVCPTQAAITKRWGIECPCVKKGHTYKIATTSPRNPNLIIAPPGLIGNWLREFGKWVDNRGMSSPAASMKIYTSHKEMADKRKQNEITNQVLDQTKAPVSTVLDTEGKPVFRLGEVLEGTKYIIVVSNHGVDALIDRYSEKNQDPPSTPGPSRPGTPGLARPGTPGPARPGTPGFARPGTPGPANPADRRTSRGSGMGLFGKTPATRRPATRKVTVCRLAASWVVMDEVHKYKGSYKGTTISPTMAFRGLAQMASSSRRPPMLLAVSGSIVDAGPSCWQGFVRHAFHVANVAGRDTFKLPAIATLGDLDKLQNDWEYIAKNRGDRDDRRNRGQDIRKFSQNTLPLLLIARRQADTFKGKPIGEFPEVNIEERDCAMQDGPARDSFKELATTVRSWVTASFKQEHADWLQDPRGMPEPTLAGTQQRELRRFADDAGPKRTNAFEMIHRSACYPYVAHLVLEYDFPKVSFGTGINKTTKSAFSAPAIISFAQKITAEFKKPGNHQRAVTQILQSSPFWKFKEQLRDTSPKIQEVERYIEEIKDLKQRKAAKGPSDDSHTRHMIVFTDTALSAFLTFMILYSSNIKGVDFHFFHSGTNAAERDRLCELMQRDCNVRDNHKVLIGTYSVMADGHHLPRSNYCIMMEVPISEAQQKQAAARIARLSQRMDMTIVQLYDPRNLMERLRKTRNQQRAVLAEATRTGDWFEWDEILS